MRFIKTDNIQEPAEFIAQQISAKLANDKDVLWLVPGGSAAKVAIEASKLIHGVGSNLYISLTDERPGAAAHSDSNWEMLKQGGLNLAGREYYEILKNESWEREAEDFNAWLARMIRVVDFKVGLFGVGEDGHTAGILPGYLEVPSDQLAACYADKQRQRISVTPNLVNQLDVVVAYIVGEEKRRVIDKLVQNTSQVPLPVDSLKLAKELIVYNDYKGD